MARSMASIVTCSSTNLARASTVFSRSNGAAMIFAKARRSSTKRSRAFFRSVACCSLMTTSDASTVSRPQSRSPMHRMLFDALSTHAADDLEDRVLPHQTFERSVCPSLSFPKISSGRDSRREAESSLGPNCLTVRQFLARQRGGRHRKGGIRAAARALGLTRHRLGPHHRGPYKGCSGEHTYCPHSTRGTMAPFKPKPRQPPMTKAELRAQGIQALAQVTTPIIKLPMKIRRQCGRCGDFNSVLVEPGQAAPAFKCSACGYAAGNPRLV